MQKEKAAIIEAYEDTLIANGYLTGRGFLTVTKEACKEAEYLETVMNFNGQVGELFREEGDIVKYNGRIWLVGKHTVTRRLTLLGLCDPHYFRDHENYIELFPHS